MTKILGILLTFLLFDHPLTHKHFVFTDGFYWRREELCKSRMDTQTKSMVYVEVEKMAENEGGLSALIRQYHKSIILDSIPEVYDSNFEIAFVVRKDGQITGERILRDNTGGRIGQQMIKIAKSMKWIPAECNKRKVASLVTVPLRICLSED